MKTPTIAPHIGYLVPKCANINHCTLYWLFGPKMCKHQPLHLILVIWSKNVQTSTIAHHIGYLVPKCAIINLFSSYWLFGPKMGKHKPLQLTLVILRSSKNVQIWTIAPHIGYSSQNVLTSAIAGTRGNEKRRLRKKLGT